MTGAQRFLLMRLVLLVLLVIAVACGGASVTTPTVADAPPTPALATPIAVPGFRVELGSCKPHRVVLDSIPPLLADHPRALEIPGARTSEGVMADGNLAKQIGDKLTVRSSVRRLPGPWQAFTVLNESGQPIAMQLTHGQPDPTRPNLEVVGVLTKIAGPVTVEGPIVKCSTSAKVSYFPPEVVDIRGYSGIMLSQQVEPGASAPAISTLVWREGDMYWKLTGSVPPDRPPYYTAELLLEIANMHLVQWDAVTQTWVEVK